MTLPYWAGGRLLRRPVRVDHEGMTLPLMGGVSLLGVIAVLVFRVDLLVGSSAARGSYPG